VPFHDPHGRKGVWEPFTRAPRHRVVRYALLLDGVGARPWTVALLADLHVGAHAGDVARYRAIVAETNALRPDLVLLLGDYMNTMPGFGGWVAPETVAAILEPLRAPHGVYAVLGNHDWRYGPEVVRAALRAAGIAMIDNEVVPVARGSDRLTLVGLDDEVYGRPDLSLFDRTGDDAPRLVVTHNPGLFLDAPEGCVMVAGHMHGGQIRLPGPAGARRSGRPRPAALGQRAFSRAGRPARGQRRPRRLRPALALGDRAGDPAAEPRRTGRGRVTPVARPSAGPPPVGPGRVFGRDRRRRGGHIRACPRERSRRAPARGVSTMLDCLLPGPAVGAVTLAPAGAWSRR
jgi:hypothetical protein